MARTAQSRQIQASTLVSAGSTSRVDIEGGRGDDGSVRSVSGKYKIARFVIRACNPKAVRTRENYAQLVVASHIPARHTLHMKNLARIRESRGLTQTQLAEMVGANQATISKIEKGVGNPTLSMILRIADALKCDPADLFNTSGLRLRVLAALEAIDDPARAEAAAVVLESMAGRRE